MPSERKRVLVVFGTRPEAIKLAAVVTALRQRPEMETIVCCTGQHRDMVAQVLPSLGLVPDINLDLMQPGQTPNSVVADVLRGVGDLVERLSPSLVVVHGDTGSAVGATLAAHYGGCPVAHVEAGLRTGDLFDPFPEEANRRLIDSVCSLLFAPTVAARDALLAEGHPPANIHLTGNTVVDALETIRARWAEDGAPPVAAGLLAQCDGPTVLMTCHRRENFGDGLAAIFAGVAELARRRPEITVLFPVHRNPEVRAAAQALQGLANVRLMEPMPYPDFLYLVANAALIITDSGGIQEEAPSFGTPVLVARRVTERQQLTESGGGILVGRCADTVLRQALSCLDGDRRPLAANPFGDGRAGMRIAAAIAAQLAIGGAATA